MIDDPIRTAPLNGTAAALVEPPRAPLFRRTPRWQRIPLEGDYAGAWVEMLLNPPSSVVDTIGAEMLAAQAAGDAPYIPTAAYKRALVQMIRDWNWATEDGERLPPTTEGLDQLEWEEINAILVAWSQARAVGKGSVPPSTLPPAG